MGFNAPTVGGMGTNDRILGSDKHPGAMNCSNGAELNGPFPTMPFFLPTLNGAALPNMANAGAMASSGEGSQSSETTGKQQRDGSSSNRNSKFAF